jgi:hypothetical protein
MSLLGLTPTCGTGVANPVYSCPTHAATQGSKGWVYSNHAFEVLGAGVAKWLGYTDWNTANAQEITIPLNMPDTLPLESLSASQAAHRESLQSCNSRHQIRIAHCWTGDQWGTPVADSFPRRRTCSSFFRITPKGQWIRQPRRAAALPVIHQNYEQSPTGGQELGWQFEPFFQCSTSPILRLNVSLAPFSGKPLSS